MGDHGISGLWIYPDGSHWFPGAVWTTMQLPCAVGAMSTHLDGKNTGSQWNMWCFPIPNMVIVKLSPVNHGCFHL
jgi:hypothetical protein